MTYHLDSMVAARTSGHSLSNVHGRRLNGITLAASLALLACTKGADHASSTTAASSQVLATVDDQVITSTDFQSYLAGQSPHAGNEAPPAESQKRLLEKFVHFEVLAKEARDRGYDTAPEVLLANKREMVNQLVRHDMGREPSRGEVSEDAIQSYYSEHLSDYVQPERVRVAQIVVRDKARAASVFFAAKALAPADDIGFRDLVARYSEDKLSRERGGDLAPFDRSVTNLPKAVVDAAFGLKPGEVSIPVPALGSFYLLRLNQRTPTSTLALAEARHEIEKRLTAGSGAKRLEDWSATLLAKHRISIFAGNLR